MPHEGVVLSPRGISSFIKYGLGGTARISGFWLLKPQSLHVWMNLSHPPALSASALTAWSNLTGRATRVSDPSFWCSLKTQLLCKQWMNHSLPAFLPPVASPPCSLAMQTVPTRVSGPSYWFSTYPITGMRHTTAHSSHSSHPGYTTTTTQQT